MAETDAGLRDAGLRDDGPGRGAPRHASRASARSAAGGSRRRRRVVGFTLLGLAVLVGGWAGLLAHDALAARRELLAAADLIGGLQDAVLAGDPVPDTVAQVQQHAAAALDATHGPHWSVASVLPWVGDDVRAVQAVSEVVDGLAHDVLPNLVDVASVVDPETLVPTDGRVDLAPLQAVAPAVVSASEQVTAGQDRLDRIDAGGLLDQVAGPLDDMRDRLEHFASTTRTAARAVQLLPSMLGADGPREYLMLVQNNAEVRASGGIPGSVVLLRADAGAVSILDTRSGGSLGDLPAPVVPLTDAESSLFGPDLAADMRDVTFTPDFPRSAEIARTIWAQQVGGEVDGVVSVDPGALALLLRHTGAVPMPPGPMADALGGSLTGDNAVEALLSTVYLQLANPKDQDAFFAATAGSVLAALVSGQGDPAGDVDALAEAARQGRLMVWSAHEDEQALLAGTVLAGELRGDAGGRPVVGVFLNDGSQAKMSWYLDTDVAVTGGGCRADGTGLLDVAVTLTNTLTPDQVATLPPYVTGSGNVVPKGEVRTNVVIYAPTGGLVDDVAITGGEPGVTSQIHDGLAAVGKTTQLAPGASVTISARVTTGSLPADRVILRTTPTAKGDKSVTVADVCSHEGLR